MGNDESEGKPLGQLLKEGVDCRGFIFVSSRDQINGDGRMHYSYASSSNPSFEKSGNDLMVFPKPGEYKKPVGLNLNQHLDDIHIEESKIRNY